MLPPAAGTPRSLEVLREATDSLDTSPGACILSCLHELADKAKVPSSVLTWLAARDVTEAQDFAWCAQSEAALWERVITPMGLPQGDLLTPARVVALWHLARDSVDRGPARAAATPPLMARQPSSRESNLGRPRATEAEIWEQRTKQLQQARRLRTSDSGRFDDILLQRTARCLLVTEGWVGLWIDLVETHSALQSQELFAFDSPRRLSRIRSNSGAHEPSKADRNLDELFIRYDLTAERVLEVFSRFDRNGNGYLSCEEIRCGLEQQGFRLDLESIAHIMGSVAEVLDERITRSMSVELLPIHGKFHCAEGKFFGLVEFDMMISSLRLAELFTRKVCASENDADNRITCYDYDVDRYRIQVFRPNEHDEQKRFFFGSRSSLPQPEHSPKHNDDVVPPRKPMRWIHVDAAEGLDRLTMLRFAVKYHLHPLAVDDVLERSFSAKMDRYADTYAVVLDAIMLAQESEPPADDDVGPETIPPRVRLYRSHATLFLAGRLMERHHFDTLITIHQEVLEDSWWLSTWGRRGNGDGALAKTKPCPRADIWRQLQRDMEREPRRRMREETADFLLYEILTRIVSELRPIAEAYARRVGFMRRCPPGCFSDEWMIELDDIQLEIADIQRSMRPVRRVAEKLMQDSLIGALAKVFMPEIETALESATEDLDQLARMAKCIQEDRERYSEKRINDTLTGISVVGSFFLPAQFITGVYGMNFVYEDGTPSLPELTWSCGYGFFWALQGACFMTQLGIYSVMRLGGPKKAWATWRQKCLRCSTRAPRPQASGCHEYSRLHLDTPRLSRLLPLAPQALEQ